VEPDARVRTEEVDDEAAVGAAAGGVAEVSHAVGRVRDGEQELVRRRHVDADVARVAQRIPEVEQGLVPPARGAGLRRGQEGAAPDALDEENAGGGDQCRASHGGARHRWHYR
jgi:hypothetical protein